MLLAQAAPQAAPSLLPHILFLAGLAMMAFFLLRIVFRHVGKRKAAERSEIHLANSRRVVAEDYREDAPLPRLLHAPEQVQQWQVELYDTARELKGELDSKLILLQHLVAQARAEGNRLEKLLEKLDAIERASGRDGQEPQNRR